jgi:hypothetical protein
MIVPRIGSKMIRIAGLDCVIGRRRIFLGARQNVFTRRAISPG